MKRVPIYFTALAMGIILSSCGGGSSEAASETTEAATEETTEATVESATWGIDAANSMVEWKGTMIGVYEHFGTINLTEGSIVMGDFVEGGSFTVDMASINPTDENYSEDHPATDLIGHLSSPDFFDVANFPTATFEITGGDKAAGTVSGNLTVRGVTNQETITDVVFDSETSTATGMMVIDRQKYGAAWQSAEDVVLSDDIELKFTLKPSGQM